MKINKKSNNKKIAIVTVVTLALLIIAGGAYYLITHRDKTEVGSSQESSEEYTRKIDLNEPTDEQIKAAETTKEESLDNPTNPDASTITVTLTASNVDTANSVLQIRTLISSVVSQGTCKLTLTKGSAIVTRTAAVQAGPSNATCQGFDIPLSELANGTWAIKVSVLASGIETSTTGEVLVREL